MSNKIPTAEQCIWHKMLADLGFEHPCETHCFRCHYTHDPCSWTDARVCALYTNETDIPTKHVEQARCNEKTNKDTWRAFREWQVRQKLIERGMPQCGVQDISFERWQKEQERKMEIAARPKIHVTFSGTYCSLASIVDRCQLIVDAGCWPVVTIE